MPVVLRELLPAEGAPLRRHVARLDLRARRDRRHRDHVQRVALARAQFPAKHGHVMSTLMPI